jgi:hypothetical protein
MLSPSKLTSIRSSKLLYRSYHLPSVVRPDLTAATNPASAMSTMRRYSVVIGMPYLLLNSIALSGCDAVAVRTEQPIPILIVEKNFAQ